MMPIDLPPKADLWLPPKPAIIRSVSREDRDLVRSAEGAHLRSTFPMPVFCPGKKSYPEVLLRATDYVEGGGSGGINVPADVAAGDILLFHDVVSATSISHVVPAGFTLIGSSLTMTNYRANISYKLADGTEGGAAVVGMNATGNGSKLLATFNTNGATALNIGSVNQQVTTGGVTPQTVTAASGAAPLLVIGMGGTSYFGQTASVGSTPGADGTTANQRSKLVHKLYYSAPVDHVITMGTTTGSSLRSFYIELTW